MNVDITIAGKELTVLLSGEIDHHTAGKMREAIDGEIERHRPSKTKLDFSGVSFMDSSGIGLIMGRYRLMRLIGGELKVINIPGSLQRMVKLSGISSLGVLSEERSVKI